MGYLDEYNKLKKKREEQMQKVTKSSSSSTSTSTGTNSPYLNTYNQLMAEREAKISSDLQKLSTMTTTDTDIAPVGTVKEEKTFLDRLSNLGTAYAKGQYYMNGGAYQSPEQQKAMNDAFDKATVKSKKDDKKWFNSGLFKDGYQFGDVSKTILGTGADLAEDALTGIVGMGEAVVDAGAYIAPLVAQGQFYQNGGAYQSPEVQKAFNQTISQAKKDSAEFMEKDLYDANSIAKRLLSEVPGALQMSNINQAGGFATAEDWERNRQMQEESQQYIDETMENESVLGEKSDALAQSAGQLAATMALQGLGVPWWLTTGATSFGGEVENALNQGATYEEAGLSAAITSGAEILTEKISGGIKFGGKTLDEGLTRQLSRVITDKTMRTLAKIGMDVAGEGGEEVLSGYLSAIGQKLTYADEKTMGELFSSEDALDAFIGGAILGGVSSAGQAVAETKKGNDYASGLTNNEKAVVDKVYQDAIAEQEADGKKLSQNEKSKIYDETLKSLEKGYIDTDTIESVIGGETYNTYKSTVENEDALQKEYDELYHMKNGEKSDAQRDRQAELKKQLDELKTNSNRTQLREQLDKEVLGLVEGSKLSESYNEKTRRKQKFEADLTQYDSKQAEVVKRAAESGILNNTNRTHDFVDMIAKVSAEKGVLFDFTNNQKLKESGFAIEGKTVNGFLKDGNISLNIDSAKALNSVVGHEITHVLEGTELYTELQTAIRKYALRKGEYDTKKQSIAKLYEGVEGANVDAEITAELVGDYLFTDADFINSLSTEHRNVFQKIYDEIKYLYKVATAGSKEARQLEKVKKAFDKAYRESGKAASDTKYSLTGIENGVEVYETSEDTKKLSYKERKQMLLDKMKNDFAGRTAKFTKDGEVYYAFYDKDGLNKGVHGDKKSDQKGYKAKINIGADGNYIELAENALYTKSSVESGKDNRFHDNAKSWDYFVKTIKSDGKYFDVLINVKDAGNDRFVYDITLKETDSLPEQLSSYDGSSPVSNNSVPQNSEKSSITYSLSEDSNGRTLSPAVKSRFSNSKAVDENGNLKVLYHGTASGEFTIFDKSKGSVEGDFGSGFYFTDNDSDVSEHYEGGGPDFENKVARRAEQIEYEEDIDYDEAEERAREELYKGSHKFEVYLNIENPAIVGETVLFDQESYLENYNEEDFDDYDDYIAEVEQSVSDDIENIVWEVEKYVDVYSTDGLSEVLFEAYYEGGIGIEELKAKINDLYLEDSNGNMVGNEVARQIIESLGYDGIIDPTVSTKWNMNMEDGTTHYIVFKPNQIKAVTNENPTDNPDIHLSLSAKRNQIAPAGSFNVYGKDIALEHDIGPVREDIPTTKVNEPFAEEYAPLTEAEANERDDAQIDSKYFLSEMAPEPEAPIYNEDAAPESPFDDRDYETIGNRKVKAYMYENPEVKPFFQEEAWSMLSELSNSTKGERGYNDDLYYETNGEMGFYGVKRHTSEDIAYLLDRKLDSYADIERGLRAIIEDHGEENNATSKRIEFLLDERLRSGYRDFFTGERIPPNQEYLNLLTEKQITEYNDEAWDKFVRGLSQEEIQQYFAEREEIAPPLRSDAVAPSVQTESDIGPVREDIPLHEDVSGQQSMFEVEDAETDEGPLITKTRKELRKALLESDKGTIIDALENAKNLSKPLMNNTDTIRVNEMVFGREAGKKINELIFQKEIDNEAKSISWQNQQRKEIKALGIKPRSKESAAVQKWGEGEYIDDNGNLVEYTDKDLMAEFPNVETQNRIRNAAQEIRRKYDDYLERANEVLTGLGFKPIAKRDNYFMHFQELGDFFSKNGIPFNPQSMQENDLPTDINGITEYFVPQKKFFASMNQRKGKRTVYDGVGGIDKYISQVADLIYHTEDIQRGRAFEELIRDTYGQGSVATENRLKLPEEQQTERLRKQQENHLSKYVSWLHQWTDNLAGKKNRIDRVFEDISDRVGFSVLDTARKQVAANMLGFNLSSSLTNFISPVQAMAKTNKIAVAKGTADTIKNIIQKDDFVSKNTFLTNRFGTDMLTKNLWQKTQDAGFIFMKGIDWFASNQVVRSKYYELISKGMSEAQAHDEAGRFAARIMGDRTKGANAMFFNSKLFNVVGQFQLEVNNQLYSMFYDTYQESKEKANGNAVKTAAGITFTLGQLFAFTHLFGKTFESVAGYNPTLDVVGVLMSALGLGDDEDEDKTTSDRLKEAADMLVDGLPYMNLFTDGGRIPLSSGIPDLIGVATGGKDQYNNDLKLGDELKKGLYMLSPTGYGQIKKTVQGLKMFDDDLPIAGSYTDSGNLRFTVEDTPLNRVQAGIFGQWSSDLARDYFDNERNPLKEKQIEELVDLDIPIRDYWEYREGLAEQKTLEDKFDYIADLDVSVQQKNIMINNIVDRKEPVDMSNYDDFSSYDEFDFYVKYTEKYNFLQDNGINYYEYIYGGEAKERYDNAYSWYKNNPKKVTVSKAITDNVIKYRQLTSALNDIRADKDEDGDSITGSAKEKKIDYINNLDLDYGQKIILFRSMYDGKEDKATYNADIVDYLNNRDDISYEEMVTILEELDMTVYPDGTVEW